MRRKRANRSSVVSLPIENGNYRDPARAQVTCFQWKSVIKHGYGIIQARSMRCAHVITTWGPWRRERAGRITQLLEINFFIFSDLVSTAERINVNESKHSG